MYPRYLIVEAKNQLMPTFTEILRTKTSDKYQEIGRDTACRGHNRTTNSLDNSKRKWQDKPNNWKNK